MKISERLARCGIVSAINDLSEIPSNRLVRDCASEIFERFFLETIRDPGTGHFVLVCGRVMVEDFKSLREKTWLALRQRIKYHLQRINEGSAKYYRLAGRRLNDPDYWPTVVSRVCERVGSEMNCFVGSLYELALSDKPLYSFSQEEMTT